MSFRCMADGHASFDQQVHEAIECLESDYPHLWQQIRDRFPEIEKWQWEDTPSHAWIDKDAMEVDPEFTSWLADALEELDVIEWRDGELWVWFSGP